MQISSNEFCIKEKKIGKIIDLNKIKEVLEDLDPISDIEEGFEGILKLAGKLDS